MKQRFELFAVVALAVAVGIAYATLIAKVTQWTIWTPLEAFITG